MKRIFLFLSFLSLSGIIGITPVYADRLSDIIEAAEQGDAKAQGELGYYYLRGMGVPQNNDLAAKWTLKAVEQGDSKAQSLLAIMYMQGLGVPKDEIKAGELLQKTARLGDTIDQSALGFLYSRGIGLPKNLEISYMWITIAADKNPEYIEQKNEVAVQMTEEQIGRAEKAAEICLQSNYQKCMIE